MEDAKASRDKSQEAKALLAVAEVNADQRGSKKREEAPPAQHAHRYHISVYIYISYMIIYNYIFLHIYFYICIYIISRSYIACAARLLNCRPEIV